jgi:hypothetical protein
MKNNYNTTFSIFLAKNITDLRDKVPELYNDELEFGEPDDTVE